VGTEHGQGRDVVALGTVLACMLAWCSYAFALNPALDVSQYAHTAWKIRDGFSKGVITSIAQTPDGYLWLGTESGLLRFDGVRDVAWQAPPNQQLPSSNIRNLLAARDGTLWIATTNGLASWRDGTLTQYLAGRYVLPLQEDREGTVWAGVGGGEGEGKLCAIQKGSDVRCYGEDGRFGNAVLGLYEDIKGYLWAGVSSGLWRWKPGLPEFHPLPGELDGIKGFSEGDDGALLIGTRTGIRRLVNGRTEAYLLRSRVPEFVARKVLRDRDGGLWIGTSTGLVHIRHQRVESFAAADGLSGDNISSLLEDREGNIWVATNEGLDRFREFAVATFSRKQGVSNAAGGSVLADQDGSVWVGTFDGLKRRRSGQTITYRQNAQGRHLAPPTVRRIAGSGSPDPGVGSLFRDGRGRIWVNTADGFGYLKDDRIVSIRGVPGGVVHSMTQDAGGNLWIAHQDFGLFRLSPGADVQQTPPASLGRKDFVSALTADPQKGGLWLGFLRSGVAYFADGQIRASYAVTDGLGEGRVNDLKTDRDGTLWAATEGGLSRLKDGRVVTLTRQNGLPCDPIRWVMEDDAHSFWLRTACALVHIARAEVDAWAAAVDKDHNAKPTIQATLFDSSDGVISIGNPGGYTPHVSKSPDGKLWFATIDGVSVVDPRRVPFNSLPPPVHVEQIIADRKTYDTSGNVRLPPLIRDLQIDYTALSLVAPEKMRFRYKLEGWDREWQDVGRRRQAFYNNLPPRNYRFRVIASNNSGVWNEAGAVLEFSVAPAYYQTAWFRLSMVAGVVVVLAALFHMRVRQVARQFNMRLDERVNERTRIARDLHDTLLQSFHGLLFRLQAASNMLPDRPADAKHSLDSAIGQAARAIAEGRDAVHNLRASAAVTNDLSAAISTLAAELAAAPGSDPNPSPPVVDVAVEGTPRNLHPILRDDIYRIAGEALRNAFRHARAKRIAVVIRYDPKQLQVRVRDDGQGIDPAMRDQQRPGHFGLPGMRERAELVGGRLAVWSQLECGTEVELTIPASIAYAKSTAEDRNTVDETAT
jgi:signal transduction histidine kinase/ligand-binding sensor domain-containing protein